MEAVVVRSLIDGEIRRVKRALQIAEELTKLYREYLEKLEHARNANDFEKLALILSMRVREDELLASLR